MSAIRFLPDGQSVRRELRRILNDEKGRRVALVAFVGRGAEAYLPRRSGLELICWPHAPGTSPAAIRLLQQSHVNVRFAKRLHMKVYWTQSQGAIVTSANLSTNAYGTGGLREAGVLIPSSAINIDALIGSVSPQRVTPGTLEKLTRAAAQIPKGPRAGRERVTFLDWLKNRKPRRWLIHCYDEYGGRASARLRAEAKKETGRPQVNDFAYCRRGELAAEDFALCIDLASRRPPVVDGWLFVHRVVLVARSDPGYEVGWPYQAGQLHPDRACPPPPFTVDAPFREAVRRVYAALGPRASSMFSADITRPPRSRLLSHLEKHYKIAAGAA